jgi:phosphoribosyl-ATP pyrophosphohydrolase
MVLWADAGVAPGDVWGELARREGTSGHAEKAARGRAPDRGGEGEG